MKFEIAPTIIAANWDDARLYCFSLNVDGKTGWRLPTIDELIDVTYEIRDAMDEDWYWSSTEEITNTKNVWGRIGTDYSEYGKNTCDKTLLGYVIPIRDVI
jgi:hypothetical protein